MVSGSKGTADAIQYVRRAAEAGALFDALDDDGYDVVQLVADAGSKPMGIDYWDFKGKLYWADAGSHRGQ